MELKAVIFDWAGTTVDFGCFAPTGVFIEVFRQKGIKITKTKLLRNSLFLDPRVIDFHKLLLKLPKCIYTSHH